MNQYISDWSGAMGDTFAPLSGEDDGLIELMWCNGHVVRQGPTRRRRGISQAAPRNKPPRPDKAAALPAVQVDDVATAAAAQAQVWFQQYPVEDPLERDDLFSELFGEAQAAVDGARGACCKEEAECRGEDARQSSGMMPPPPPRPSHAHAHAPREKEACPGNAFPDGAAARTSAGCEATATTTATEGAESSMLTIGSSFCGSNHVQQTTPRARGGVTPPGAGKDVAARARGAATDTSSATRSRSCTTKNEHPGPGAFAAAAAHRSGKRKQSDATDAEDVEFQSADVTCELAHKTTTAKRRRAAEVHNLSERRRRDRINEKMKALQELIPHCNKTDKASMLDEAIEYLKSLQLQLQMMWMGGGMAAAAAPVVFPAGVHQYMQRMVAGPPPHHVASMPGMPFMAPPAVHGPPPPLPDLYARYPAVDHHLPPPPPPPSMVPSPYTVELPTLMNSPIRTPPPPPLLFADGFQQHCLQAAMGMGFYQRQNPALPPPPQPAAAAPSDGILHKKYENCGKPEIQGMTG